MKALHIAGIAGGALAATLVVGGIGWAVGTNAADSPAVQQAIQSRMEQRDQGTFADGPRAGERLERQHEGARIGAPGRTGERFGHDDDRGERGDHARGDDEKFGHMDEEPPADSELGTSSEPTDEEMSPLQ